MRLLTTLLLLSLLLAGCETFSSAEFSEGVRDVARTYSDSRSEKKEKEADDAPKQYEANNRRGDANDRSMTYGGDSTSGGGPGSGSSAGAVVNGYEVINIQGETYTADGPRQTSDSGFWQHGQWYRRSNKNIKGREYVVGNQSQGGGFWQHSKYWVPAGHGGGGGGGGGNVAEPVINIRDETYVASGTKQTSDSGFWQNGQWYARSRNHIDGVRYVEGNRNQSGGFWQHGKYWVRASSGGGGGGGGGGDVVSNAPSSQAAINIQGETWVTSGSKQTSQSGFWYGGQWYTRSNSFIQGREFVVGNQSQGNGFWQHGKYWVPKN
jgi:hypothetical protein